MTLCNIALWIGFGLSCSAAAEVSFVTKEVEYRLGENVMIPLKMDSPVAETTSLELKSQKAGIVEILRQPEILKGQDIGFARIRTLSPGEVTLKSGNASIVVRVAKERPVSLLRKLSPRFTSPSENSSVWGKIAIGADLWVGAPGVDRTTKPDAKLRLPDGRELKADEAFPPMDGPFWRLVYYLDTASLPPGPCQLTISCKPPLTGGAEGMQPLTSEPHLINILPAPKEGENILSGECEGMLDTPRAERMGTEPPMVMMDAAASGHRAVTLLTKNQSWVVQPEIPEDGNYQIMVRARGTLFGSAYASLGIILGENVTDSGSVRLSTSSWQRVPVGRPIKLSKGKQWVGIALANEYRLRNQNMRHADIDQFEIRRVPNETSGGGDSMMSGMMMQSADNKTGGDQVRVAKRLQCAFSSIRDGEEINGRVDINATLQSPSFKNDTDYREIRSDLWINDAFFATSYGRHPQFQIHPHDLKKGENRIQVKSASPCGNSAVSLSQTLLANSKSHPTKKLETGYDYDRYDLNRAGWDKIKRVVLEKEHPLATEGAPPAIHAFAAAGTMQLNLPTNLTGSRQISVLAHSMPDAPAGEVTIKLHQPKAFRSKLREVTIAKHTPGTGWKWQPLSSVDFVEGQKFITVTLSEGQAAIGGISIDTPKLIDATPPTLQVLYPKAGSKLSVQGDAVIVNAFDDLKLSHFDVLMDGRKTGLSYPALNDTGPMIFHIPGSLLEKGSHKMEILAYDASGKEIRSSAIPVEIRESNALSLDLPYPRAVRLANRLAYGPDRLTMIAILTQGENEWIAKETATSWGGKHDQLVEAYARAIFPDTNEYNLRGRVVTHLILTKNPVRSRFWLLAQNHFSTWVAKTGVGAKWRENEEFRDVGITRFHDLLLTSATSPAMMVYLDQQNSLARQLNENYARELMELHTVGVHGGYQQIDVTNLAHLLTGWGAQREATMDGGTVDYNYRFSPYLNEPHALEIFGLSVPAGTLPETADDRITQVVEMLACRPQTASFISGKVAAHYMGIPTDEKAIGAMTSEYLRTNGDLRRMIAVMVQSPAFMANDLAPKMMTPIEFGVSMQRITNSSHPWSVIGLADRSGRNLFDRASPDGYPETNQDYADSNYQLQKWSYCKELEHAFANSLPHHWFEPEKIKDASHRDAVIDYTIANRCGIKPSAPSREALHSVLNQEIADAYQRRILFATVLHMMPEFQNR